MDGMGTFGPDVMVHVGKYSIHEALSALFGKIDFHKDHVLGKELESGKGINPKNHTRK